MGNDFSGDVYGNLVQAGRIDHLEVHYRPPAKHTRQLPPIAPLIGRSAELAELHSLADATPAAIGVSGPRWVGKSALAVTFAHEIADRYPDGQLYLDLRGNRHNPVSPEEALRWVLRSWGLAVEEIPDELPHLVSAYRSAFAERRVLIVLDNLADETTIELFTTRVGLVLATGIGVPVFPRGVAESHVRPLNPEDAAALLRREAGADTHWHGDDADRLAGLCGGLPLPLIAAADHLRRVRCSPRGLADLLTDGRVPLSSLMADGTSLGDSMASSCRRLPEDARSAFRRLGVFPGATINGRTVEAALGTGIEASHGIVRALVTEGLLIEHRRGGTTEMPAPFRMTAEALLAEVEGPTAPDRVRDHILDHYADAARSALSAWLGEHPPDADAGLSEMVRRTSRGFFLGESETLLRLLEEAATRRLQPAVAIAVSLIEYLTREEADCDLQAVQEPLLRAVTDLSDDHRDAFDLLLSLNRTYLRLSRPAEAAHCLLEARDVARAAEDDRLATAATRLLLAAFTEKLEGARASGNRARIADSLVLLAGAHGDLGDPSTARQLLLEALTIHRGIDDTQETADVLSELGDVSRAAGHLAESLHFLRESVRLFEEIGDRQGLALALGSLAETLTDLGMHDEAAMALERSDELLDAEVR